MSTDKSTHTPPTKLSWWLMICPWLLVIVYSFLSYVAFADPTGFYTSMDIPIPEHGFVLLSWGGKNTAIVVALILANLSRQRFPLIMMLTALLTMQFGDVNAGVRTNVNVFVTFIGMGLVLIEAVLLAIDYYKKPNSKI